MRKKLIIALTLQLTAVAVIFAFSPVMEYLTDQYGTEYSFRAELTNCFIEYDNEMNNRYNLEFEGMENNTVYKKIQRNEYRDISDHGNIIWLYIYNNDISYYGSIPINDEETGRNLRNAYSSHILENSTDESFYDYVFNNYYDIRANIRVFGSRIKLISLTVDGKDAETFFREEKNIIA